MPRHFRISELIEAAKDQLGEHLGDDYALLSEMTHPNSLVVMSTNAETMEIAASGSGISHANAELLLKICAQGIRAIGHNAQWLLDWSASGTDAR